MAVHKIKRGDTRPTVVASFLNSDGTAVDLTSALGVTFLMKKPGTTTVVVDAPATIVTASSGLVRYDWTAANTSTAGLFNAEFEVQWGVGDYQTFPTEDYLEVEIFSDLGGDA